MPNDIRRIIKEGYEKGDFAGVFRSKKELNLMEKRFFDYLSKFLPQNAKILDLGCGTGLPFSKYFVDKGFELTGVDISQKHIKQAKKNIPNAIFIEGDFSKIDFEENSFDAIIALYSIFHIPREEQSDLFGKINNLLKDEGMILITFGTSGGESIDEEWCGAPMAWSNYTPEKYKKILCRAGFEIVVDEYEGKLGDDEYHWWVLAKKQKPS